MVSEKFDRDLAEFALLIDEQINSCKSVQDEASIDIIKDSFFEQAETIIVKPTCVKLKSLIEELFNTKFGDQDSERVDSFLQGVETT